MVDVLKSFPYPTIRPHQLEVLQVFQDNYDKYDVFVIQAPTAAGKSAVAKALMNACRSVSVITPTNLLVNQFLEEFPDTPTLARLDSYYCDEWKRPCSVTRNRLMKFCKGCKCSSDLATAKYRRGPGIYNYYTYLSHKLYRDALVVDEAHNLIPTIRDRMALTIWQHDVKYPSNMYRPDQVLAWIQSLPENKRKGKKIQALKEACQYKVPEYVFQRTKDWFNGKGTQRGEPELRDCIRLLPVDISQAPEMFWPGLGRAKQLPGQVQKLILLSATIGAKDIEQMGLGGKRVLYIKCKSPIPWGSRPIIPLNLMSVNRSSMETGLDEIAEYIQRITDDHPGEKGIVHVTYQLASALRDRLSSGRFLFHDRDSKSRVYMEFRDSSVESGRVLVACGMYEGVDLPEDLGRWQIIAKVPWQSLASPAIKHLADLDPEWYVWECMKTTIQACGRVCRTPEDYGSTFIIDRTFSRLMREGRHMVPEWFTDAIVSEEDVNNYLRQLKLLT